MNSNKKDKMSKRFNYYWQIVSSIMILILAPIITIPKFLYEYLENLVYGYKEGIKLIADFMKQKGNEKK